LEKRFCKNPFNPVLKPGGKRSGRNKGKNRTEKEPTVTFEGDGVTDKKKKKKRSQWCDKRGGGDE